MRIQGGDDDEGDNDVEISRRGSIYNLYDPASIHSVRWEVNEGKEEPHGTQVIHDDSTLV